MNLKAEVEKRGLRRNKEYYNILRPRNSYSNVSFKSLLRWNIGQSAVKTVNNKNERIRKTKEQPTLKKQATHKH